MNDRTATFDTLSRRFARQQRELGQLATKIEAGRREAERLAARYELQFARWVATAREGAALKGVALPA